MPDTATRVEPKLTLRDLFAKFIARELTVEYSVLDDHCFHFKRRLELFLDGKPSARVMGPHKETGLGFGLVNVLLWSLKR